MLPEDIARPPDLGASPPAIRAHYDTGNDFFAKWLDPSLCYSAARWAVRGIQRFLLGFETGLIGLYRAAWNAKAPRRP
jgi:hypothetical protein